MFLEGLLGGIQGFGSGIQAKQAASDKAAQDKKTWLRDVMKGLMIQQLKPKSGEVDWAQLLGDEDLKDIVDPDAFERLSLAIKNGNKVQNPSPRSNPSPYAQPAPQQAQPRLRLKPLGAV